MDYFYSIIPTIILLPFFLFFVRFHLKKKAVMKKVNSLSTSEKRKLLDEIARPAGYFYEPGQDIFTSRLDAPQKYFGYTTFYDLSAPYFNMIFDYETIYFDYQNRTWLIEMWKGQYGINTGCELGIYYADRILPPEKYAKALFHAVDETDMLYISTKLNCQKPPKNLSIQNRSENNCPYQRISYLRRKHWWLTIFQMGTFSRPENLFVNTSIRFKNHTMLHRFLESFERTLPDTPYKINGLTIYFTFHQSFRHYSPFQKVIRRLALFSCRIYCKWFLFVTRPYETSGDKILYLYYYLPFVVRHLFQQLSSK